MQRFNLIQTATAVAAGAIMMAGASSAFAQSAVLKVTGTITPPACTPSFAGGDTVDFGNVTAGGDYNDIGTKQTTLQISCTAPRYIAFKVRDDRNGTQVGMGQDIIPRLAGALFPDWAGASGGIMAWNDQVFGLGKTTAGKAIGAYSLRIGKPSVSGGSNGLNGVVPVPVAARSVADTVPVVGGMLDWAAKNFTLGLASHGLWMTSGSGSGFSNVIAKDTRYTVGNSLVLFNAGSLIPVVGAGLVPPLQGKTFSFPITVHGVLNTVEGLGGNADQEKLDGQATFDLVYI